MASEIKANKISPATGTDLTIGDSGDTLSITGTVSTTGNSTNTGNLDVTGDLTVDTNTLYVDSTSNKVGVGTTSPTGKLSVVSGTNSGITVNDGTVNTILYNTSSLNGSLGTTTNHPMAFYTNNAERMRIDSSGNVLFNTTGIPNGTSIYGSAFEATSRDRAELNMALSTTESGIFMIKFFNPNGQVGGITTNGSATAYNTSSDQRLKESILDAPSASNDIDAIQVRSFVWKADGSHQKYGMVAQELQSVAPEAVSAPEDPEEMMGVDYSKLVPMMLKEIQSLRARVAQLES